MKDFSYITNSHPAFIEGLYQQYLVDVNSIDQDFRKFFDGFDFALQNGAGANSSTNNQLNSSLSSNAVSNNPNSSVDWANEIKVYRLILGYRNKGHLIATTNPIKERKNRKANLDLAFFGLGEADLNKSFHVGSIIGLGTSSLQQILGHLQNAYARNIGIEFKYISDQGKLDWLTNEMENNFSEPISIEQKKRILEKLNQGVIFEKFLHTKYIGQKRFSLEGGESTIAALDAIINVASDHGVQEVVIGMAHRGRLNILANIMGKTYEQIFSEFEGTAVIDQTMGSGDVKYHMGFSSEVETTNNKKVYLQLMQNPSHLEAVDPVVLGFARAKADILFEEDFNKVLPILIHGDASIAGQGIVYEILQMCDLHGYKTGGTIHFVINNQIGFTTDFDDARSANYCTSVAAMVQAPVIHVNGDDVESVYKAVVIATKYRQIYKGDFFIDMVCYRKHGHNEGDDPKYTQPQLYSLIEKHKNPREIYVDFLLKNGEGSAQNLAKEMEQKFWSDLQARLDEVKQHPLPYKYQAPELAWKTMRKASSADFNSSPSTAIEGSQAKNIFDALMKWPSSFHPLKKVDKLIQEKIKLLESENKIDWATGELMAYASLLAEGKTVRMSGQDVKRGTFSHRHAVLFDENTNEQWVRLDKVAPQQQPFRIYNSLLSEYGVLGFEYGYSLANPNALVIWEAQFGDFSNGAQTIIDQFIAAGEQKWQKQNGVVMLLPHGYEGQGPEHSSARMERFLQMCAENNMVITNITTAANLFHALRRQLTWEFRKPMINFSPKANLRSPWTFSDMSELSQGGFKEVIDDNYSTNADEVKKVLFCTGKIYYELAEKQKTETRKDIAIVRLEQLYPLATNQIKEIHQKYAKAIWFWVQEEPLNMGAASFLQANLKGIKFGVISRQPSASTATGYTKVHAKEQNEILTTAFSI